MLNDPIVPLLWKGQQWSTNANGGTYTNRTLNDSRRDFPAVVSYGPAFMDGRPSIVATYPSAVAEATRGPSGLSGSPSVVGQ